MKFIVRSTSKPYLYVISKNEVTDKEERARWFDFGRAHENKRFFNRKTNPKTLWEIVEVAR